LYTEATPESLPEGASPLCVNCDFIVGQVNPRPGKENVYYYADFFSEKLAGFAQSVADTGSSGEDPWTNPNQASKNLPGSPANVTLNFPGGGGGSLGALDKATGTGGAGQPFNIGPLVPALSNEWALATITNANTPVPTPEWSLPFVTVFSTDRGNWAAFNQAIFDFSGNFTPGDSSWCGVLGLFFTTGSAPVIVNSNAWSTAITFTTIPRTITSILPHPVTPGSTLFVIINELSPTGGVKTIIGTDGTIFTLVGTGTVASRASFMYAAQNVAGGSMQVQMTDTLGFSSGGIIYVVEMSPLANPNVTGPISEQLQALNFPFNIPNTQSIFGFQVEVTGTQGNLNDGNEIIVSLVNPTANSPSFRTQLPLISGTVTVGTPQENWGLSLSNDLFNNPNFAVQVQAVAPDGTQTLFQISAIKLKVWVSPDPPPSFNYLKTFAETAGEVLTLALGSDGVMYQEDAINDPNVLHAVYTQIEPDSFAQSATVDDREFIAISNLANGTDIPLTYTPPNFDRLSQVGPGAPPSASTSSAGATITSITQNPIVLIPTSSGGTSGSYITWSDSPQDHGNFGTPATPGNVMSWVFPFAYALPSYIKVGVNIVISGVQSMNGYDPNNGVGSNPAYYTITSVGQPIPGEDYYVGFTITLPQTGFYNLRFQAGSAFQATLATMTTPTQIPNLEVGGQFQVSGTGGAPPAGYDNTWIVLETPNASQMQITSTVLNGNVATYGFNLITGSNPVVGQAVTVTQTLNGNGVFNVVNAIISATSPGTFSLNLVAPNVISSAESGAGIIFGTIFVFDAFAIIGNKLGGSIVTVGLISSGIRKACYSFLTRNGFMTQPSPILTFDVPAGASGVAFANLAVGPSNVIARIIHLTAANGGNFYNIPEDVTVIDNGVKQISKSTWVNDNTTTNVVLSFSDGVLLGATQIDIEGNNLFALAELGSCVALVPYSNRLFAIGEQNKITNLLNYSFDGGRGVTQGNAAGGGGTGTNQIYPLGWTVDPTNGAGGTVQDSPIFGDAYVIDNETGSTQAIYGMITQNAFQDEFQVAIVEPSTTYSVRITCSVPTGPTTGNLIVDLFSAAFGTAQGTFTLALSTVATSMLIYTGTLLTTKLAPVPNDLTIRLYAQNILNGVQIKIDRVEIFPTEQPNLNQQVTGSYQGNFESFDQITGVILGTNVNQQPIVSAFVLSDSLFLIKTGSMVSISDNNTTEPNNWNQPRTVSAAVGASGPYAVTTGIDEPNSGEEYAIVSGRTGAFIYAGGQPIKLTEEIQSAWNTINWKYGYTHWATNKQQCANRCK